MNKYKIKEPIWDGGIGKRAIGLATFRVPVLVDIVYESQGERVYPKTYVVTKEFADKYPIKKYKNSPPLYIIPIEDLIVTETH